MTDRSVNEFSKAVQEFYKSLRRDVDFVGAMRHEVRGHQVDEADGVRQLADHLRAQNRRRARAVTSADRASLRLSARPAAARLTKEAPYLGEQLVSMRSGLAQARDGYLQAAEIHSSLEVDELLLEAVSQIDKVDTSLARILRPAA
jgi:hypothetical protein